jgi:hypothetical protein
MSRKVLISHPGASWREYLKDSRGKADLLCLDPSDPVLGQPARICLMRGDRPVYERFYGSLDAGRSPHVLIAAMVEALAIAREELVIQMFGYRPTPVLRQTLLLALQLIKPDEILIAAGTAIDTDGFPIGPEEILLDKAFPHIVQVAQRKAQWLSLIERCESHTIDLRSTTVEGGRLGSGTPMDEYQKTKLDLHNSHVEVAGSTLFVVTDSIYDDEVVARALDTTHTTRAHFIAPAIYNGLLCAFSKSSGQDFGFGYVDHIDFINLRASIFSTAVPPVPVRILRLGSLRIDRKGNELSELKPWQV